MYITFNSLLILFSPTKLTITQHYLPPPPPKKKTQKKPQTTKKVGMAR